jgi:hypothetical protein
MTEWGFEGMERPDVLSAEDRKVVELYRRRKFKGQSLLFAKHQK